MERTPPRCPAPPGRRLSVMNKARKKVCGGCWPDRTCMGRGAPSDSAHKEGTSPGPPGVSRWGPGTLPFSTVESTEGET